jgi:hypothetical protein
VKIGSFAIVFVIVMAGCGGDLEPRATQAAPTPIPTVRQTSSPKAPTGPPFEGEASPLSAAQKERMTPTSWRAGCPVALEDLRFLEMSYRDPKGVVRRGEMVVHTDVANDVLRAFERLFVIGYPITKMRLIDEYGGDDDRSMLDDNTSGFNCRRVKGSTNWSQHSFGRAVDVNPFENPWVKGDSVDPPQAAAYADRSKDDPRLIHHGDGVWRAFRDVGWGWGGDWSGSKDYQHFSASGR